MPYISTHRGPGPGVGPGKGGAVKSTSLTMTNQTISAGAVENDDVGQTVMKVKGDLVTHVTTHDGVLLATGPSAVTLDSLVVDANLAAGTVVANIGATGGSSPFTFTELPTLSAELIIVGTELQTAQKLVGADTHNITIGVTDNENLSFDLQPAFTITVTDIAAVLSSPTGTQTGETTADGSVVTDLPYDTLYWIVSDDVTAPTAAEIRLGQESGGAAADASDNQTVTAEGTENVSATGLVENTTYFFHFMQDTVANLASNIVTSASFKTAAIVAVLSLPTGVKTGSTTATGTVSTTYDDGILYFQATTSATPPSLATMRAGTNQAVVATGVQNVSVTGLTPETTHFMHFMHDNDDVVASNQVVSASFITDAAGGIDFDFTTMTPSEAATNLTWVRASAATSRTVAGVVVDFATGIDKITDKGILHEESRTNVIIRSEEADNAAWQAFNLDRTGNDATAPDTTTTATLLEINTASSAGNSIDQQVSTSMVQNDELTVSIFAKEGTTEFLSLGVWDEENASIEVTNFDLSDGTIHSDSNFSGADLTIQSKSIEAYTDNWYRCVVTVRVDNAGGTDDINMIAYVTSAAGIRLSTVGDNLHVWGMQTELLETFVTSYIPTVASTVTRAVDLVKLTDPSAVVNTEGIFTSVTKELNSVGKVVATTTGAPIEVASTTAMRSNNSAVNLDVTIPASGTIFDQLTTTLGYDGTDRELITNSSTPVTDTNLMSVADFTDVFLGSDSAGNNQSNGFTELFQWDDTNP